MRTDLQLGDTPDPDLFIRTGGEQRVSNFLLWNLAYTELYFCDVLWPDFDDAELERAFRHYGSRQRRFGLTAAQVGVADSLRQRVLTALLLAGLVIVVLLGLPGQVAVAVIALVILAGAWEWAGFAGLTSTAGRAGYAALVAITIALLWTASGDGANLRTILLLTTLWWLAAFLWLSLASGRGGHLAAALAGLAVLAPAAVGLAHLVLIEPHGRELLLFLLVLIAAADVGAYFGGRRFGRRKLAPPVSPGKTWEGLLCGHARGLARGAGGARAVRSCRCAMARALSASSR